MKLFIFVGLLVFAAAKFEEEQKVCERDFKKIGCFKEDGSGMKLILTDRDESHSKSSGFLLKWKKMAESLHSLACRCSEKARENGYTYFSIRYFAECWAGKDQSRLESILRDSSKRSNECVDPNFQECDNKAAHECAGKGGSDYVFTLEAKAKQEERINGGYSGWSEWSVCSKSCGSGVMERERYCSNPKPLGEGSDCTELGPATETKECKLKDCPVNGQWSNYGPYRACSKTCGQGVAKRERTCTNPRPANGGKSCKGSSSNTRPCQLRSCPINGQWSNYGPYGTCSKTCGQGVAKRARTCTNPRPANGGKSCAGSSSNTKPCQLKYCPSSYSCHDKSTPWNLEGKGHVYYLDRHSLTCGHGFALHKFQLRRNGKGKYHYSYRCCSVQVPSRSYEKINQYSITNSKAHSIYLDRQRATCYDGPMSAFRLDRNGRTVNVRYVYSCARYQKSVSKTCYTKINDFTKDGGGNTVYLDRQTVECNAGYTMWSLYLRRNSSHNKVRYEYQCCKVFYYQ